MLLRLARRTYVRQYGEFTYVYDRVSASDQIFQSAGPFFSHITRRSKEKKIIIDEIASDYSGVTRETIERDFEELFNPLIEQGIILSGSDDAALDAKDFAFTYECEDPKTRKDNGTRSQEELASLPAAVMEKYFAAHPTLFDIQIDVTQACTERCRHCYIPDYDPVYLSLDKIRAVLDEFRDMGGMHVSLSGGECMMHRDIVKIIRAIHERDCTVTCLSNLTMCTDEIVHALVETNGAVQVSLYSMSPTIHDEVTRRRGSWLETMISIMRLRAAQIPVYISCPCMRVNYKHYPEVMKFAASMRMSVNTDFIIMGKQDCDTSNLCNRLTLEETRELLEDVILKSIPVNTEYFSAGKKKGMPSPDEWKKQKICGACVNSLCLSATGEYYPCAGFAGVSLGNCYRDTLRYVWHDSGVTKRIRSISGKDFEECAHCKDRDYCSICLCRNFNESGDMFTPAEHFCKVAAINHDVVDKFQRKSERM